MTLSARVREQLISSFRAELAEHVQTMTDGLLALEQHRVTGRERRTTLEDTFRAAHSLKGAARAIGATVIEQLAHALEDVLAGMQQEALEPSPELFTTCYRALDAIQAVQAAYEAGETAPPVLALQVLAELEPFRTHKTPPARAAPAEELSPAATGPAQETAPPAPGPVPEETIRISVSKLDALMAHLSELFVTKIRAEQRLVKIRQLHEFLAQWQKDWLSARSAFQSLSRQSKSNGHSQPGRDLVRLLDYTDISQERLRQMNALLGNLAREHANDVMHLALVIDQLEEEIKRARMLPLNTITGPFGRMVRDLAQAGGKEATLQIVGGETELDKQVLEQIKDPLIHLLRNAIDHGIEPPKQRKALGKPRCGTITLTAEQLGKEVVISVSDDGGGLALEAIRHAVAQHDGSDAQALSEAELVEAIFRPGISTSQIITDISGRGIGLDVVRRNVEALQGRVLVEWTRDVGTTFTLILPLTLTSSRGLLVRTAGQLFAIPLNHVERILHIGLREIAPLEGRDTIRYAGRPLPLVWLDDVLELPRADIERDLSRIPVVILQAAGHSIAFVVDELAGEQEVVIKGLGRPLVRVGGVAGATVMGSGEVLVILNVADLIKLGLRGERRPVRDDLTGTPSPTETRARQRILIVDDSITTRTLEKNILEATGYTVQVAIDGQEALDVIAAEGPPDLIISDIVMPRVDGFELTRQIKGNPRTAHLPVILVTSLGSAEDKARGIEAGADAYIVKSAFEQTTLLETIEQLI